MIRSNHASTNVELFEELNDQVSEKISGGAEVRVDIKNVNQQVSEIVNSSLSDNFGKKLNEVGVDTNNQQQSIAITCVNDKCTVTIDGKTREFDMM